MLLQTDLGGCNSAVDNGQKPGLTIAMPIDGNGSQAAIEGDNMRRGGDAGLAQHGVGQRAMRLVETRERRSECGRIHCAMGHVLADTFTVLSTQAAPTT